MNRIIVLILLCGVTASVFSQGNEATKERTLIILSSADNVFPAGLKSEIRSTDSAYKEISKQLYATEESIRSNPEFKKMPASHQTMTLESNRFIKNISFFNSAGFNIARYLQQIYTDYGYKNFNVFALNQSAKPGNTEDLQKIALKFNVKYVLNIYKIEVFAAPARKAIVRAELYDARSKKLVFQKDFEGNSDNPGGYFMCESGSMSCCLSNATEKLFGETLLIID